jgi:ethanolamine utilization cobalamin adenosyltransferase
MFHSSNKLPVIWVSPLFEKEVTYMAVLTEGEIRKLLKGKDLKNTKELEIPKKTIVTPSAKGFLSEHHIQLKYVEKTKEIDKQVLEKKAEEQAELPYKYKTVYGGYLQEKPEHMTALTENILVFKDHKRIIFRGKLDSLESKILETQITVRKLNSLKLVDDLQEVLKFVRNILRSEVLGEEVKGFFLQDMNPAELREMSHHPSKYFSSGHFIPDYQMGEILVWLNTLRSTVRETELAAYDAFKMENGDAARGDIILALNRLSSLFYIMMIKFKTGHYKS